MPTDTRYIPPTSRYTPIWRELKTKGKVRLTAPTILHKRIIKAVKKRKDKDLAYRFSLSEDHKKARLVFETDPINPTILVIHLNVSIGLSEI